MVNVVSSAPQYLTVLVMVTMWEIMVSGFLRCFLRFSLTEFLPIYVHNIIMNVIIYTQMIFLAKFSHGSIYYFTCHVFFKLGVQNSNSWVIYQFQEDFSRVYGDKIFLLLFNNESIIVKLSVW